MFTEGVITTSIIWRWYGDDNETMTTFTCVYRKDDTFTLYRKD